MSRIGNTFARLKAEGRKALVTFAMAGDPDIERSVLILAELAGHADIIEIGMPFSDPMADGPVIQAAGLRALRSGTNIKTVLEIVQQLRSKNIATPIVLMGYINPILRYGIDNFLSDCSNLGVDGLIVVDLPPEHTHEIALEAQQKNIHLVKLVTPTSTDQRLDRILDGAGGFLYYVSIAGVTGTAKSDPVTVGAHIAAIKARTDLPVVAGFGIKTPSDAAAMAQIADGVVVGSALVETIARLGDSPDLVADIGAQAAALKAAVNG